MQRYLAAANPIPLWFAELMDGDSSSYGTTVVSETLKCGGFVTTVELFQNLSSWAKLYAPSLKMQLPKFEKAIKAFASENPNKLCYRSVRSAHAGGAQHRGYVDPIASTAAAQRRVDQAAVHTDQFNDNDDSDDVEDED